MHNRRGFLESLSGLAGLAGITLLKPDARDEVAAAQPVQPTFECFVSLHTGRPTRENLHEVTGRGYRRQRGRFRVANGEFEQFLVNVDPIKWPFVEGGEDWGMVRFAGLWRPRRRLWRVVPLHWPIRIVPGVSADLNFGTD